MDILYYTAPPPPLPAVIVYIGSYLIIVTQIITRKCYTVLMKIYTGYQDKLHRPRRV